MNMHTESEVPSHHHDQPSLAPNLQDIAKTISFTGWITVWVQLVLLIVSGLALLFAATDRDFAQQQNTDLGVGIFWGVCGIVVLLFSVYWNFGYTRLGKRLANPNLTLHPSKGETLRAMRLGIMVSLVGILISILGAGATVGLLVGKSKSVSQPPGVAITDPYRIIRAMDVFVEVANINSIAAHFVSTVDSLWLLEKVHHH
jgi:heme/copper-type cytochrome/quinol oxidase subunit 2